MSPTPVIELHEAGKVYRRSGRTVRALDGATFTVEGPGVHAFLGPNGAGKTTALRALLGHVRLTSGMCRLLGQAPGPDLHRALARTGALIETPRFPPALSATQVLDIHGRLTGVGSTRVASTLQRVGLADRAGDRVGGYSLGMRQRLGLAVTLLNEPEVLILDEPANGLDPPGIRELRTLLRGLGDDGVTVFVSSHLLGEVEQISDTVTVLRAGHCVHSGPLAGLRLTGTSALRTTGEPDDVATHLRNAGWTVRTDGDTLIVEDRGEPGGALARCLAIRGWYPTELRQMERSLDEAFAALTGPATHAAPKANTAPGRLRTSK